MNYLREINRFHQWLVTHSLSAEAQALWFFLMAMNNSDGWGLRFRLSNQVISGHLRMSSSTLWRRRDELVKAGRISIETGSGGSPTTYQMMPLLAVSKQAGKTAQAVDKSVDNSADQFKIIIGGK